MFNLSIIPFMAIHFLTDDNRLFLSNNLTNPAELFCQILPSTKTVFQSFQ